MNSFEQLDAVLTYVADASITHFDDGILRHFKGSIDNPDIGRIVLKLINDGYVEKVTGRALGHAIDHYIATFDGVLFLAEGGYSAKIVAEAARNMRVDKLESESQANQVNTVRLTAVVVVIGLFPAIHDYIETLHWYQKYPASLHWMVICFFSGIVVGWAALRVLPRIASRK